MSFYTMLLWKILLEEKVIAFILICSSNLTLMLQEVKLKQLLMPVTAITIFCSFFFSPQCFCFYIKCCIVEWKHFKHADHIFKRCSLGGKISIRVLSSCWPYMLVAGNFACVTLTCKNLAVISVLAQKANVWNTRVWMLTCTIFSERINYCTWDEMVNLSWM